MSQRFAFIPFLDAIDFDGRRERVSWNATTEVCRTVRFSAWNLLVGVVWAAIHFRSDSYSKMSFQGVLLQMATRLCVCVALNYILSWMTLRQGSVTCAAIAHGTWNLLNLLQPLGVATVAYQLEISILFLGIVAVILFRSWPVEPDVPPAHPLEEARPAIAT